LGLTERSGPSHQLARRRPELKAEQIGRRCGEPFRDGVMNLRQLTEAQFMCDGNSTSAPAVAWAFDEAEPALTPFLGNALPTSASLRQASYELVKMNSGAGDVGLLHAGTPVGFYCGEALLIDEGFQRRRLSTPLILAAVPQRILPFKRTLSANGEKALRFAWRVANGFCLDPWP
jgi:hypothetical protein